MHDTASFASLCFSEAYGSPGKVVVDIGGLDVNGTLRNFFVERGMKYICIDMESHPSVDIVIKPGEKLTFENQSVDLIVSTSSFEHDPLFWMTFKEMCRIVKLGGFIYINAPSNGVYHCHPGDNWRFYADAGQALAYWSGVQISNEDIFPVKVLESFHVLPLNDIWIDFVCVWERVNEKETDIVLSDLPVGKLEQLINRKCKIHRKFKQNNYNKDSPNFIDNNINNILNDIHSKLKIKYGSFNDEVPEQKMVVRYLTGNEKILEIGGNIGRNSLVIYYILKTQNNHNFVVLESDPHISKQLEENRVLNKFNFHIENSALSKRKLIQKGWDTVVSDVLLPGYKEIKTISLDELNKKYNINFDTLVLDCEGAFYYILMDMPEILDNINLIIMENDYHNIEHKNYIDSILNERNFYVDYNEAGGWGPCQSQFFQVWKRKN